MICKGLVDAPMLILVLDYWNTRPWIILLLVISMLLLDLLCLNLKFLVVVASNFAFPSLLLVLILLEILELWCCPFIHIVLDVAVSTCPWTSSFLLLRNVWKLSFAWTWLLAILKLFFSSSLQNKKIIVLSLWNGNYKQN